mgnify:CR=1 FL=1
MVFSAQTNKKRGAKPSSSSVARGSPYSRASRPRLKDLNLGERDSIPSQSAGRLRRQPTRPIRDQGPISKGRNFPICWEALSGQLSGTAVRYGCGYAISLRQIDDNAVGRPIARAGRRHGRDPRCLLGVAAFGNCSQACNTPVVLLVGFTDAWSCRCSSAPLRLYWSRERPLSREQRSRGSAPSRSRQPPSSWISICRAAVRLVQRVRRSSRLFNAGWPALARCALRKRLAASPSTCCYRPIDASEPGADQAVQTGLLCMPRP